MGKLRSLKMLLGLVNIFITLAKIFLVNTSFFLDITQHLHKWCIWEPRSSMWMSRGWKYSESWQILVDNICKHQKSYLATSRELRTTGFPGRACVLGTLHRRRHWVLCNWWPCDDGQCDNLGRCVTTTHQAWCPLSSQIISPSYPS